MSYFETLFFSADMSAPHFPPFKALLKPLTKLYRPRVLEEEVYGIQRYHIIGHQHPVRSEGLERDKRL